MNAPVKTSAKIPFDTARLDRLMDEAGMDVLIATSKHNVQYLLGGHRAFFFDYHGCDGAVSRYLPVLVYAKGAPDKAAYFGHRLESFQQQNNPFWTPVQQTNSSGSVDTMQKAIEHIRSAGIKTRGIGAELSFLPVDAGKALSSAFSDSKIADGLFVLERLRSIKTPEELKKLKIRFRGGDRIDAGGDCQPQARAPPRHELTEALRREETNRGLTFDYCLITAGTSLNRAPSEQVWGEGDILSLDSGGNYHGYIGDLCRMAIHGEPDAELRGHAGRHRGDPARVDEADQGGRDGQRNLRRGRSRARQIEVPQQHAFPRPRHGPRQPRGAAPYGQRAGAL